MSAEEDIKRTDDALVKSQAAVARWSAEIVKQSDFAFMSLRGKAGAAHTSMVSMFEKTWKNYEKVAKQGSSKALSDIKKDLRSFATFAPQIVEKAGEKISEVLAASSDIVLMSSETKAKYVADVEKMKDVLKEFYNAGTELSEAAEYTVLSNNQNMVRGKIRELQRIQAIETTTEEGKKEKAKRSQDQVDGVFRVSSKKKAAAQIKLGEEQTARERKNLNASLRISKDASTVLERDTGMFGSAARMFPALGVQRAARTESSLRAKARAGGKIGMGEGMKAAFASQTIGAAGRMAINVSAVGAALGGVAAIAQQVMAAFNGMKMTAAQGLEVMSVQGSSAGSTLGELAEMATQMQIRSLKLSGEVLGTGADMDKLNTASAAVAKTLGGLGKGAGPAAEFIDQLSRIQLLAPLAGMSGADAMNLIAKAQRGFDLKKSGKVRDWFMDIRVSALMAKTTVSSLAGAVGDLEQAGAIWGDRAKDMHRELASLAVGFKKAGGSESARLLLVKGFGNLRNLGMAKMVGMTMFGRNTGLGEAVGRLQQGKDKGGIASELVGSFRGMLQKMNFDMGTKEGQFEFAQVVKEFGGDAFGQAALYSPKFQKAILDKTASKDDVRDALIAAQSEFDTERKGAEIQANQLTTLEQLLLIITQLSQFLVRSTVFKFGTGNEAIRGRIEAGAGGLEEQGDLLRRMRGAR